jgi:hypothetical protein
VLPNFVTAHFARVPFMTSDGEALDASTLPLFDEERLAELRECFSGAEMRTLLGGISLEGGQSLRDVATALSVGDFALAQRAAHTLKGLATNLGAARLAAAALKMELAALAKADTQSSARGLAEVFAATEQELGEVA